MEPMLGCDPSLAVLSLLAEYHDCADADLRAGQDRRRRACLIQKCIADRLQREGRRAVPVQLELHRPVQLTSDHGDVVGATYAVALDDVEVALAANGRRRIKLRSSVVVSIQTGWPKVWWRFLGRVTRIHGQGRTVTVRLLVSLGCVANASPSLEASELRAPAGLLGNS